jgi:hypothetical protein
MMTRNAGEPEDDQTSDARDRDATADARDLSAGSRDRAALARDIEDDQRDVLFAALIADDAAQTPRDGGRFVRLFSRHQRRAAADRARSAAHRIAARSDRERAAPRPLPGGR